MIAMLRKYFRLKVLLGAILLALVSFAVLIVALLAAKPEQTLTAQVTALVNIIPAPSSTPAISQPTPTSAPTAMPGDSQDEGVIEVGAYVQVSGTGGTGFRMRTYASLEAEVRLLGTEAEIFEVKDGPQQAEGYTWWYLVSPSDQTRQGWAVKDYLVAIQNP